EAPLATAPSVDRDEGAPVSIPCRHRPFDRGGDVARSVRLTTASLRTRRGRELLPRELVDEHRERAVEHLGEVAAWDRVREQVLREPQLLTRLGTGGEADLVALGGQRPHTRVVRWGGGDQGRRG